MDKASKFHILPRPSGDQKNPHIIRFKVLWGAKGPRKCTHRPNPNPMKKVVLDRVFQFPTTASLSEDEISAVDGLLMLATRNPSEKIRNEKPLVENPNPNPNPGQFTKKLTESDLYSQSRLMIGTGLVKEHILPYIDVGIKEEIKSEIGWIVGVKDCDTGGVYKLVFKWWKSNRGYVFVGGWRTEFARRRGLKKGDKIGLRWNLVDKVFEFSVLERSYV